MAEKLTVEHFVEPDEIAEDTRFTEATLDSELIRQAALVAHYGVAVAKAQHQMDRFKHILEIRTAQEGRRMRDEANEEGRKITEKQIELDLALSPKVIAARSAYNEAKSVYETLRTTVEALRHKRDAMIQIGVARRLEMETQGRIVARDEAERSGDARSRDEARERLKKIAN